MTKLSTKINECIIELNKKLNLCILNPNIKRNLKRGLTRCKKR